MKIATILVTVLFAFSSIHAQSDTSNQKPVTSYTTFTSYLDGYFRADFAGLKSNNKTSFTNSNNKMELGMASFKIDQTLGKFAGTVDLGVGKRAEEFSYNDNGIAAAVKQAYVSYAPNAIVKFTVGKWATHIGYELLDAYANRNYSMSYGFSYGPFFHTGVKADISLGGKTALMIGYTDPCDYTSFSSPNKHYVVQISSGTKDDKLKGFLNYYGGKDKSQFDLVLNGVVSSQLGINYDGTVCNVAGTSWTSNALYFNYDPSAKLGFTLRSEYFDDTKSAAGVGTSVFQNTFSVNVHVKKLTIIPELRFDNAGSKIFVNGTNTATHASGNFLIAAVYKF